MGVSYKGRTEIYHSINDNIPTLAANYPYHNGYFGDAGTSTKVRIIYSDDPATTGKDFYDKIAHGGIEEALENGKGFKTTMADGTIITFRPSTKSDDNPGVYINISESDSHGNLKQQKIHFEKGGDD